MRAVAHVINNRVLGGRWKFQNRTNHALVCLWDQQFSCWNADAKDKNRESMAALSDDDLTLEQARKIVADVSNGEDDLTNGATHYYSGIMNVPPAWALSATLTVRIGRHLFYKDVT